MRANVYRNIDAGSTLLGLAFPLEVLAVLAAFWLSVLSLSPWAALAVTAGVYVALRAASVGKPSAHLQHLALFHARRLLHGGHFCPAARSATGRPFLVTARRFREPASRPERALRAELGARSES